MSNKKPNGPDWLAIRRDCEAGTQSLAAVARAHGISSSQLYSKRRQWKNAPLRNGGPDVEQEPADHRAMVKRLYHATDRQIRHLETQLESGTAAFDEKEARMLGTIARTLDKIMELTPQADDTLRSGSGNAKSSAGKKVLKEESIDDTGEDQSNLDGLREELAIRLDRLQQGAKGKLSGDTERS